MMSLTRPKILLLDDDELTLDFLKSAFASMPFDATFTATGIDALVKIFEAYRSGEPFTALILDCALPHFDGFTIARIVRIAEKTGISPRARIGYFTAFAKTVDQSTLLEEVGAEAYWHKPEDSTNLPQLIALWLQ